MSIKISQVKSIRESLNLTHLVLFGIDADGVQYVVTHGLTESNAKEAASLGNQLKTELQWEDHLCNDTPLKRVCENCTYYKPDYGYHCFNGWTRDGSDGWCQYSPTDLPRKHGTDKCSCFEPKF